MKFRLSWRITVTSPSGARMVDVMRNVAADTRNRHLLLVSPPRITFTGQAVEGSASRRMMRPSAEIPARAD